MAPPPDENDTVEGRATEADEGQPERTIDSPADFGAGTSDHQDLGAAEPPSDDEGLSTGSGEAASSAESPAGADLQLPSIDFSMPDLGTPSSTPIGEPSTTASGELPAHLQLPNFPDFELPPIPGEERSTDPAKHRITEGVAIEGAVGGSFGAEASQAQESLPATGEPATAPGTPPAAQNWSVADATQPMAPPPLPPSQRPREAGPSGPEFGEGLPSLPGGLALPSLGPSDAADAKEPTLVQSEVAARMAQSESRSRLPYVVVGGLLLLLVGVGGTVAYYGPSTVASWLGDKPEVGVLVTRRDEAEEHNYAGEQAYLDGQAAEKGNKKQEARAKYKAAIASFRKALAVDETFAKAHRNLAIALARSNKQAEAVQQYRTYLRKEPNAPDRKAVLKIINDWEASQEKKRKR